MNIDTCASRAAASQVNDSMVEDMVSKLIGLAGRYKQHNHRLLFYFADDIKRIALEILSGNRARKEYPMLNLARQCYLQAITYGGLLHCDRYFHHLQRGTADQPPVKAIHLENYAEPEFVLALESSVPMFPQNVDHKVEREAKVKQRWNHFWGEALHNCPGPILFQPLTCPLFRYFDFQLDNVPRYLFRTFDPKSFGRSNEDVIASPASENRTASNKFDIFSLNKDMAMSMLDRHLNPWAVKDYEMQPPDNFMSWTSSLLYAIQYALYRRYHYGCASDEIKICVIDTKKFQQGQFIHAKRLLKAYYDLVKQVDMRQNFGTRLLLYIYQNGEYLSQGSIDLRGRSCVASLAGLEESGLYSLYPEFAVPERQSKWAVTTARLRKLWTEQDVSTYRELETALLLARACFAGFDVLDIAIIFLSFKKRKLKQVRTAENQQHRQGFGKDIPDWGRKPQEVRQYLAALHVFQPIPRTIDESTEEIYPEIGNITVEADRRLFRALLKCFPALS
ncbi:hypothetical protein BDV06DRAFT_233682 [Aspergillus oleicola]